VSKIFHLYIEDAGAPNYFVRTGARSATAEPVTMPDDQQFRKNLEWLYDRTSSRPQVDLPAYDAVCSEVGKALFRYFIESAPKALQEFEKTSQDGGPRVALHLAPSLYRLPWEVLCDPKKSNFIAISQGGSVFRCDESSGNAELTDYPAIQAPLDLIFVLSNPTDRFFGIVTPPNSDDCISFTTVDPPSYERYRQFISKISRKQLGFIFIGHGDVINKIGHIVFVDPVRENIFFSRYAENPRPGWSIVDGYEQAFRLGIFCACESAWARGDTGFDNSVVGAVFRKSNSIAYVIGAQTPIEARAAQIMLGTTLSYLAELQLDLALSEARSQIRAMPTAKKQSFSSFDWWIPVLYTKTTNLQILERKAKSVISDSAFVKPPLVGSNLVKSPSVADVTRAALREILGLVGPERDRNLFD
jgi:hypothetical protein